MNHLFAFACWWRGHLVCRLNLPFHPFNPGIVELDGNGSVRVRGHMFVDVRAVRIEVPLNDTIKESDVAFRGISNCAV